MKFEDHCLLNERYKFNMGSDLVDMVRGKHYLNIIEEEELVENSRVMGHFLLENLLSLQQEFPKLVSNARGLGLMCSFDLPNSN